MRVRKSTVFNRLLAFFVRGTVERETSAHFLLVETETGEGGGEEEGKKDGARTKDERGVCVYIYIYVYIHVKSGRILLRRYKREDFN